MHIKTMIIQLLAQDDSWSEIPRSLTRWHRGANQRVCTLNSREADT